MVYQLVGLNKVLKKSERLIKCEICGTEKIVKMNKYTCSSKCSRLRSKFQINFIKNQSGTDWPSYIQHRLNLWKSKT